MDGWTLHAPRRSWAGATAECRYQRYGEVVVGDDAAARRPSRQEYLKRQFEAEGTVVAPAIPDLRNAATAELAASQCFLSTRTSN